MKDAENNFQKGWNAYESDRRKEAVELWREAAKQGDVKAQYALGGAYAHGNERWYHNGTFDWVYKVVEWIETSLHKDYTRGHGVPKNYKESVYWYRKAAEHGLAEAQYALGVSYEKGRGVIKHEQTAYMWFLLAESNLSESNEDERLHDKKKQEVKDTIKKLKDNLSSEKIATAEEKAVQMQIEIENNIHEQESIVGG